MADHLAVLNMSMAALRRSATVTSFEPLTLLSALAMVTQRIGLIATASTTFDAPYHIARRFASLDHISNGRAGWNIVTTSNPDAALNFGLDDHVEHDERYRRALEFHEVVTGLWDSFTDDAWLRDQQSGLFFDPEKMHVLNHKGEYLSVRGPLNIARPVQGWPVIVQAGASEAGRQLAAQTAEAIFGSSPDIESGRRFYADVKARMRALGRPPEHLKILPAALVIVGRTREEAREKQALLDSLVHPDSGVPNLSMRLGVDASGFALDEPLPDIPQSNASHSSRDGLVATARRGNLTVRQLAQIAGSYGGFQIVGTPTDIADTMQEWLETEASDGFNVMFHTVPSGLISSWTSWSPNFRTAASSGVSIRARRCASTSACRDRKTGSFRSAVRQRRPESYCDLVPGWRTYCSGQASQSSPMVASPAGKFHHARYAVYSRLRWP